MKETSKKAQRRYVASWLKSCGWAKVKARGHYVTAWAWREDLGPTVWHLPAIYAFARGKRSRASGCPKHGDFC